VAPSIDQHPALQLWDAGYRDLIPIIPPGADLSPNTRIKAELVGKIPGACSNGKWHGFKSWQSHETSREDVEHWISVGSGFGLRTRNIPTVDIDVDDASLAADIVGALVSAFGWKLLRRTGRAPRVAIPFQTDKPFGKIRFVFRDRENNEKGVVEILGNGNQFVVFGTHPATGNPYTWTDGDSTGGAELLASHAPTSLPALTEDSAQQFILRLLQPVARRHGLTITQTRSRRSADRHVDQQSLRAPSMRELADAVAVIPNDGQFEGRDKYIEMLAAIRAAGFDDLEEAFSIALEWTDRWDGPNDPQTVRRDWDSLGSTFSVGWDYIAGLARANGYAAAALDFEVTELGPPITQHLELTSGPNKGESRAVAESERIAALHGDPVRAFFLELPSLPDGELKVRWKALQRAALTVDPLRDLYLRAVLPTAVRVRVSPDEEKRFASVLESELATDPRLDSVSLPDRRLLLRTAYAHLASLRVLTSQLNDGPGNPLPLVNVARDDLVWGLIPAKGVAALVGAPGQGKSFLALELAARIAKAPELELLTEQPTTEHFADREVRHGSVLYFASEDVDGVRARAARWKDVHGDPVALHIFGRVPPLSELDRTIGFMLAALEAATGPESPPLRLVVIDVLRAAIEGDENSSDVVGPAMVTASVIARMTGAAVLLVHHAAINAPERGRGSSAFTAAMDMIGAVSMNDTEIALKVVKNKNAAGGTVLKWQLQEGVLRYGSNASIPIPSVNEACAVAAGTAIRQIAIGSRGVTRRELAGTMISEYPDLFGSDVKRSTAESRITRGIYIASERHWLVATRDRFHPGPEQPDVLPVGELAGAVQ
jgi:hypothetical protein